MRLPIRCFALGFAVFCAGAVPAFAQQPATPSQPQQNQPPRDASAVDRASCVVAIRSIGGGGYSSRDTDLQTINATLTSTSFIDPILAETLKLDSKTWPSVVTFDITPAGSNSTRISVKVSPHPGLPESPARKVLNAMTERLAKVYPPNAETRRTLEAKRAALEDESQKLQQQSAEIRASQDRLSRSTSNRTGTVELPLATLQDNLEDSTVRLQALTEILAAADKARQPLIDAAQAALKARTEIVDQLTAQANAGAGTIKLMDISRAKADAADAELRLAEVSVATANDPKNSWFNSALQMRLDVASLKAKIERRTARDAAGTAPDPSEEIQKLSTQQQTVLRRIETINQEVNKVRSDLAVLGPEAKVVVLGADEGAK